MPKKNQAKGSEKSNQVGIDTVTMSDQNSFSLIKMEDGSFVVVSSNGGIRVVDFIALKELKELLWDFVAYTEYRKNTDDLFQDEIPF